MAKREAEAEARKEVGARGVHVVGTQGRGMEVNRCGLGWIHVVGDGRSEVFLGLGSFTYHATCHDEAGGLLQGTGGVEFRPRFLYLPCHMP